MTVLPEEGTLLVLTGMGIPLWSARGITQTMAPIDAAGQLVRNASGEMMDLSHEQFRKYATTITCNDMRAPALDGIWPGTVLYMDCVAELCRPYYATASRPAVEGSERHEGDFVHYRPILQVMLMKFNWDTDEWGAKVGWNAEFEEI